ncbi:phosphotransferase family enzyme [Algoriphagus boseongensis]|uniref:Phosphotransferase family enzyme n=1 Tax=Algoriphagus boseongensis TaxID=1442587 RepID=A0A4R6T715_9BACT|nr:aminoglycoside phosphotransferase family protein [Algoriphagus boseongensis]TDQ17472.1 phosphotransferase family enzyme [Algoriphagus boseongensis]
MNHQLDSRICEYYPFLKRDELSITPFGEGLIHETLLVESPKGKWILQGFNEKVFNYPDRIDHNLGLLYQQAEKKKLPFTLPLPLLNRDRSGLSEINGLKYRLFEFVAGKTLQQIEQIEQAYIAALAYGEFASWAKDIPAQSMQETIPHFHRLDLRFEKLIEVSSSKGNLEKEEVEILDFYFSQKPLVDWYQKQLKLLPLRVVHNDTKINNVIFSEDLKRVSAVIDLDTLMGGYLLYDFGDLVRTVACSLTETSTQWDAIHLIPEIFSKLLQGYWEGIETFASKEEAESLILGGEVMTMIMGLRFFTDHLQGNIYYRVSYPEQNFHRAKNQMIFLKSQQSQREALREIWKEIVQKD